jgi:hypothetical protein
VNADQPTITVSISREAAYDFMRQLAEDDDLRSRVEADPGTELANAGIHISPELLPARARLASKGQMEELVLMMGDDPADKFGRPKGEAWLFHVLCYVFMLGALPFTPRAAEHDGAS